MNSTDKRLASLKGAYRESINPCPVCGGHWWLMMSIFWDGHTHICAQEELALVDRTTKLLHDMWLLEHPDTWCLSCDECQTCGVVIS